MSETDDILRDIRAYIRTSAASAARTVAGRIFDVQEKVVVYDKMNGSSSFDRLEELTKVPASTIGRWADMFVDAGLASPPDNRHPSHRALFTSKELGVNVELLKKRGRVSQAAKGTETLDNGDKSNGAKGDSPNV